MIHKSNTKTEKIPSLISVSEMCSLEASLVGIFSRLLLTIDPKGGIHIYAHHSLLSKIKGQGQLQTITARFDLVSYSTTPAADHYITLLTYLMLYFTALCCISSLLFGFSDQSEVSFLLHLKRGALKWR